MAQQTQRQRPRPTARHAAPKHAAPRQARTSRSPARRPQRPQPKRSSVLPIVIIAIVVLGIGVGAFFAIRSCTSAQVDNAAQTEQQTTEVTPQEGDGQQATTPTGAVDVNLLMVGDMLFHYQVRMSGLQEDGSRNYDHLFTNVASELEGKDIKVINQETPIAGPIYDGTAPDGYDGYPEFNGPQEVGDAEVKAGFNVILKATNHAMDNSGNFEDHYALVKSEQNFWASSHPEVAVIGEANPDVEGASVDDIYVYEKDGFKVALLNYTQDLNGNEGNDYLGMVSMLEEEHVRATMARAREEADMIVVFPHWGEEYNLEPVQMQYDWAQIFVEEGADVIIGNHPHVMEPVTVLDGPDGKKVPCYWSTGNFVSTSPSNESLVGGIAEVTLRKEADGTCSVAAASFVPIVTHIGLSTDLTTYLARDWNDDLASTNYLNTEVNPDTDNTSLTKAWLDDFCTQVLGSSYDAQRGVLELDLSAAPESSQAEEQPEGEDATATEVVAQAA